MLSAPSYPDPFEFSNQGKFSARQQPAGLLHLHDDIIGVWMTAVYLCDYMARDGKSGMINIVDNSTNVAGFPFTLPICTIQDFMDWGWRDPGVNVPAELAWYVGTDFSEHTGDPNHPSILGLQSQLNEEGDFQVDPSLLMQWLLETNGYLNPLMTANLFYDRAHQTGFHRPAVPMLMGNTGGVKVKWFWNYAAPSTQTHVILQPSAWQAHPLVDINQKILPVASYGTLEHWNGASTGTTHNAMEFVGNGLTNSMDFMMYEYHDHVNTASGGTEIWDVTRLHTLDPLIASTMLHPRASWPSHLAAQFGSFTFDLAEYEERHAVQLGELAGNFQGHQFIWSSGVSGENGFAEQFLDYTFNDQDLTSLGSITDSNAVMMFDHFVDTHGVGWFLPTPQFMESHVTADPETLIECTNYIPCKREYTSKTINDTWYDSSPQAISNVIKAPVLVPGVTARTETLKPGYSYPLGPVYTTDNELAMDADHGFALQIPFSIDKQTSVGLSDLEPGHNASNARLGVAGTDIALSLSPDPTGWNTTQIHSAVPVKQGWDVAPATGNSERWHAFRWMKPVGGTTLHLAITTPAVTASHSLASMDLGLLQQFKWDGNTLTFVDGSGIVGYLEVSDTALTELDRKIWQGVADCYDPASTQAVGWHAGFTDTSPFFLLDEYTGALSIYAIGLPGYAGVLHFSQLDNRLVKDTPDNWSDLKTSYGSLQAGMNTGTSEGFTITQTERLITPEDVTNAFYLANNIGGGLNDLFNLFE